MCPDHVPIVSQSGPVTSTSLAGKFYSVFKEVLPRSKRTLLTYWGRCAKIDDGAQHSPKITRGRAKSMVIIPVFPLPRAARDTLAALDTAPGLTRAADSQALVTRRAAQSHRSPSFFVPQMCTLMPSAWAIVAFASIARSALSVVFA